MHFIKVVYFLLIVVTLFSCRPATLKDYDKPYFDFDSLVNHQIKKFSSRKDSIRKVAVLDTKKDTSSFIIDSVRLAHEWDVFRQLDWINKPIFKGTYQITDAPDTKSNLTIRSYKATTPSPVPLVHFYFQQNVKNLKRIEAAYLEQNALYYTKRKLTIEFDGANKNLIRHYSIEGSQKMILSDSVKFSIHGSIFL
jgi:hypothetical protein